MKNLVVLCLSLVACGPHVGSSEEMVRQAEQVTAPSQHQQRSDLTELVSTVEPLPIACTAFEFAVRFCHLDGTRFRFFYDSPSPDALAIDLALDFGDDHIGIFRAPIGTCGSVDADIGRSSSTRMRIATMNTDNPNMSCDESTIVDQLVVAMTRFNSVADCR